MKLVDRPIAVLVALTACVAARAEASVGAGLTLRTDAGVHALRPEVAWRGVAAEAILVLDPWVIADGEHDGEVRVQFVLPPTGWWALAGIRTSTVLLPRGAFWQHEALAGAAADLPAFPGLRLQAGIEIAWLVLVHGAGGASRVLPAFGGASILETLSASLFLRGVYEP